VSLLDNSGRDNGSDGGGSGGGGLNGLDGGRDNDLDGGGLLLLGLLLGGVLAETLSGGEDLVWRLVSI
jgi:hypothetical protein